MLISNISMGFTTISEPEALQLMSNYQNNIRSTPSAQSIYEMFNWNTTEDLPKKLRGFSIPIEEFVQIASHVGVTRFMISFGLELTPFTNRPPFTLIIQGRNEVGSIKSPYYKLINPISMDEPKPVSLTEKNDFSQGMVPSILYDSWTKNWSDIINNGVIPPSFCMISTYIGDTLVAQVLNGYCFNQADFINTLYPAFPITITGSVSNDVKLMEQALLADEIILYPQNLCFYLVDHHYNENADSNTLASTIGLVICTIANTEQGTQEEITASFYDFSAPCPPTCP